MRRSFLPALLLLAACGEPTEARAPAPGSRAFVPVRVLGPALAPPTPGEARPRLLAPRLAPPLVLAGQQLDTFDQSRVVVDLLWVVDNSGSMADERARLGDAFDAFLAIVLDAGADYRIGVTTTEVNGDDDDGRLVGPPIDRATADPAGAFRRQLELPETIVRREQGLEATRLALDPARNPGFTREGASLAVIVLSDEDDDSFGEPAHFARLIDGVKGPGWEARTSLSAIAGPLPSGCRRPGDERVFRGGADAAVRYAAVVAATGGELGSICADDFSPSLRRVALALDTLRRRFPLSLEPIPGRIEVRVRETEGAALRVVPAADWRWDEAPNELVFEGAWLPPPGAHLEIEYALAGTAP